MIVPMLAGTVATALLFAGRDGGTYSYVVGAVFGLSSLGMVATSMISGAGRRERIDVAGVRRAYDETLAGVRATARANAAAQRAAMRYRHPAPGVLVTLVDSARLWERRPGDADFGAARIGSGPQELTTPLLPSTAPTEDLDPVGLAAMRHLIDVYAIVDDLPVALAIPAFSRVHTNDAGVVRALLAQLAFAHAPGDLLIAACPSAATASDWEFLKWLPHAGHPRHSDTLGPARLVRDRLTDLETLLADVIEARGRFGEPAAGPLVIVVIDGGDRIGAKRLASTTGVAGCCVIELDGQPNPLDRTALTLFRTGDGRLLADGDDVAVADACSVGEIEALARALAPIVIVGDDTPRAERSQSVSLDGLLGLDGADSLVDAIDAVRAGRPAPERLRIPIGVRTDGQPLHLDLKEAALDGMGPHGLIIGATGSGKSELLRTLVLGLAATHDAESLNFVLIDFKGGATFAPFDRLPHTAAVITNLADELPLVDRMSDALNGELVRRQELLRRAGNLASLSEYERVRTRHPAMPPIPVLLIVCDEFSELLSAKPEFIDLFVAIGRLGRSLGVHLLLASQRLDEGRLRGLDTHLSYRIGLRTFSAMESRAVLGVPDAFELPRSPGHGYLKAGTEPLVRFKAAYSSEPYRDASVPVPAPVATSTAEWRLIPFTIAAAGDPTRSAVSVPEQSGLTVMDALTRAIDAAGPGRRAHRVWLPPLSSSDPLDSVLGTLVRTPERGLTTADSGVHGRLQVPVGIVDKPFEQRREPLWLALDGAAGHVVIVGAPQSGKSTVLRTLICALALTHTAGEISFYCLDFGGGSLGQLRDLPHVGAVAGRLAADEVRRTVGEIGALLAARERDFATERVDSIAHARASGLLGAYGDVFLVVDGWASGHTDYDDLEPVIIDIATRGLSYGVHVIVTTGRWADLRPAFKDVLGSRVELRLGDPGDSQISRKAAMTVPLGTPGRGLTPDERHFMALAPQLNTGTTEDLVKAIASAWQGVSAPAVRRLPSLVSHGSLHEQVWPFTGNGDEPAIKLPLGIAENDLSVVFLDFEADPHLLILGESGSGKSAALRSIAASIIAMNPPEQARLVVIDYRRAMLGEVEGEHLIGYATSAAQAATLLSSVAEYMHARLPGPDVTPKQLRDRSWFSGPECFILIDDYDLVAGATNPLSPLLEFLAQARDVGLHVIIARRSGGAGRAQFEPIMARLREIATPGLILSADGEEGPLIGVRPQQLPPGRATYITRRDGARMVQLAYLPPTDTAVETPTEPAELPAEPD
jgi:S-DNA-T family DNA segregation ATPase FtsK/SpoIIIE